MIKLKIGPVCLYMATRRTKRRKKIDDVRRNTQLPCQDCHNVIHKVNNNNIKDIYKTMNNTVFLSEKAKESIENIRDNSNFMLKKSDIADSLSTLAGMMQAGRDDEGINVWTDEIISAMHTIGEYNNLINNLNEEHDQDTGKFRYVMKNTCM